MEGGFAEFCYSNRISFLNLSAFFRDGGFPRSTAEKALPGKKGEGQFPSPNTPKLGSMLLKKKKRIPLSFVSSQAEETLFLNRQIKESF